MKSCRTCGDVKPLSEFYKHDTSIDGLRGECKICTKKRASRNYSADQPRQKSNHSQWYKNTGRHNVLKKNYGISKLQYDEMFKSQKGLCAICFQTSNVDLAVDHNHATGRIRELLCLSCNVAIGRFRENSTFLLSAINYLQKHSAPPLQPSKEEVYAITSKTAGV